LAGKTSPLLAASPFLEQLLFLRALPVGKHCHSRSPAVLGHNLVLDAFRLPNNLFLPSPFLLPLAYLLSNTSSIRSLEMASDFQLFPELPTEIQIKIWKLTCEVPRVIELGATPKNWLYRGRTVDKVDIWQRIKITSNSSRTTLIPAALETCVLSREIALKHYGSQGCSIFNPAIDTLYFGSEFDFIMGWDHWTEFAYKTDIRYFAFHLPTFRRRQDFHCMEQVAWERQVEGITFTLDAPIESLGDTVARRFAIIDHQEIAANKALRSIGKVFKNAQSATITECYEFHNACFRQSGRYSDEKWWQWKMPKINFMLEDEAQARNDREARRVRRELAAIAKEKAEYEAKT
jgi:hypothetical protein